LLNRKNGSPQRKRRAKSRAKRRKREGHLGLQLFQGCETDAEGKKGGGGGREWLKRWKKQLTLASFWGGRKDRPKKKKGTKDCNRAVVCKTRKKNEPRNWGETQQKKNCLYGQKQAGEERAGASTKAYGQLTRGPKGQEKGDQGRRE